MDDVRRCSWCKAPIDPEEPHVCDQGSSPASTCSELLREWVETVQMVDSGVYEDMIEKTEDFLSQNDKEQEGEA